MAFYRKEWTAAEADEWTKEDWYAIVLSPIIYLLLTLGAARAFLFKVDGFICLFIGIVLTILMHKIIDPKLKAISSEYEKKQQEYLSELEAKTRWE